MVFAESTHPDQTISVYQCPEPNNPDNCCVVLKPHLARLDYGNIDTELEENCAQVLETHGCVSYAIDLTDVEYMSSAGMRVLVSFHNKVRKLEQQEGQERRPIYLLFSQNHPRPLEALSLTGLQALFNIVPDNSSTPVFEEA